MPTRLLKRQQSLGVSGERSDGSDFRVLFQNAEGNINMGFWFDDPDIEKTDICWYNTLAKEVQKSLKNNEGLISVDKETDARSCYVELLRKGLLNA